MISWTLWNAAQKCTTSAFWFTACRLSTLRRVRTEFLRGNLIKMNLNDELMSKVLSPELKTLSDIFKKYKYELRMAGGAVRDLLTNKIPEDIDFATTATPDEMKAMFEKEQVRMINMKGEKHGTITARINDKENFEVTTLRIDVVTDGRHAEVKFTKDWELDSGRRDLTINSMFLDLNGVVYDYFNGAEDLRNNCIRFVGTPQERIQEDYLRILRYFRFFGRISHNGNNHEESTLEAIRANVSGLSKISGERIWTELRKISTGNYAGDLITLMVKLGVGPYMGFPDRPNLVEFELVWKRAQSLSVSLHPITLLTALFVSEQEGINFHTRLKLSSYERDLCYFIISHRQFQLSPDKDLRQLQKLVLHSKNKVSDVQSWVEEMLKYRGEMDYLEEFRKWVPPKFPVSGHELKSLKGVPQGRGMSKLVNELKEVWIDSKFEMTKEELLAQVPQILDECGFTKAESKSVDIA